MKNIQPGHISGLVRACLIYLVVCSPAFAEDGPAPRSLSEILPGNYHRSNYYRINDFSVNNNNYLFTVESDYGNFRIESVGLTLKYLRETEIVSQVINQIAADRDPREPDLQSQLRIRAESAIDILASPLGTATNLAGQLARNLGDTFAGNSPYVIQDNAPHRDGGTDPNLSIHKRNISSQLLLDVYTSNNIVQHMLTQLARERSAGNISSGSVLVNVNNNYEKNISGGKLDREINRVIRKHTIEELYHYNSAVLQEMGIPEAVRDNFLMHGSYSPYLQTSIIKYLDYLYPLDNRREFLALSLLANDEVTASTFARILKMIAWYTESIEPVKRIKLLGTNVSVISRSNHQVVIYPDDLFYLNDTNSRLLNLVNERSKVNNYAGITMIAYGSISDMAKTAMLESNIDYYENFLF